MPARCVPGPLGARAGKARALAAAGAALALALALCACGSTAARALEPVTLVLDFTPNPVHVGIYTALARGYDRDEGISLHVIAPSASTDAIRLLETGSVDFAILDIHDLAIARERGEPLVGILPIVQEPLAAVIAQPSIASPRMLAGRTVGITGDPSDTAVLDSIVSGAGGNPRSLHTVTIGYDAVADLLAGRVAAATAFWNDEGVALRLRRPGFRIFRVQAYGAPSYPELVVCTTAARLRADPGLARALVRTLVRGYDEALAHPRLGQRALESLVPGLSHSLDSAELSALRPAFTGPEGRFGAMDMALLGSWARWEARFGIVRRPVDVAAAFDPAFAP
ncbi:MAG TPA: ABC transporter substrate-binding protein [Solirubrobacteraceae bacterium]|nr:ABC transporter substrate-binding protein [Solirubrobacteraceae bacterium]